MDTQDALAACAAHVERGDPDRFLAVMATPPAARPGLFALYAVNLEVARAPWVTREPLLARMRLQFWRELVTGERPPTHEFAAPMRTLIADRHLDTGLLLAMIDAREAEIGTKAPFADTAALWRYLDDGAGGLLALAVQVLADIGAEARDAALALGAAQGLANYLMAVPALEAAGRLPLPDGRPEAIAALARTGLVRIEAARPGLRAVPPPARPALLAAWRARAILLQAARDPGRVAQGRLVQSEFRRRGSLLWRSLVGM